jgi:hypothetical protein
MNEAFFSGLYFKCVVVVNYDSVCSVPNVRKLHSYLRLSSLVS